MITLAIKSNPNQFCEIRLNKGGERRTFTRRIARTAYLSEVEVVGEEGDLRFLLLAAAAAVAAGEEVEEQHLVAVE